MILDKTGYEPDNSSDEEQYETEELLMENLQRDRIEEPGISLNENMGKEDLPKKDKTKIITNKKSIIKNVMLISAFVIIVTNGVNQNLLKNKKKCSVAATGPPIHEIST